MYDELDKSSDIYRKEFIKLIAQIDLLCSFYDFKTKIFCLQYVLIKLLKDTPIDQKDYSDYCLEKLSECILELIPEETDE